MRKRLKKKRLHQVIGQRLEIIGLGNARTPVDNRRLAALNRELDRLEPRTLDWTLVHALQGELSNLADEIAKLDALIETA